ncbi:MAG: hypothetical protein LBS49_06955, partial [Candidatus Accumulibacter sp.]|nr:hypothetical protein [Accumulibacter sp.]
AAHHEHEGHQNRQKRHDRERRVACHVPLLPYSNKILRESLRSCFKKNGYEKCFDPKNLNSSLGEGRAVSPKPPPPGALGERALLWMIHLLLKRLSDF